MVKTVFLGLTERHNESICLFFYSMRLHPKIEGKDWKSVHKIKADRVSPVMLEKQKPLLELEYELYAFAEKLFNARIEWMKQDFTVNKLRTIDFVGPDCDGVLF